MATETARLKNIHPAGRGTEQSLIASSVGLLTHIPRKMVDSSPCQDMT